MTSLLVVGGDEIEKLAEKLEDYGFDEVIHVSGRKAKKVKTSIPPKVEFILILTDYINHNLSSVIKRKAHEQSIPLFCQTIMEPHLQGSRKDIRKISLNIMKRRPCTLN